MATRRRFLSLRYSSNLLGGHISSPAAELYEYVACLLPEMDAVTAPILADRAGNYMHPRNNSAV